MLFKYKLITKYLFFVLITMCSGQQYFSPLIPNNYFIPNAADLAKGVILAGPFSDNIFKDASQNYNLEINVILPFSFFGFKALQIFAISSGFEVGPHLIPIGFSMPLQNST